MTLLKISGRSTSSEPARCFKKLQLGSVSISMTTAEPTSLNLPELWASRVRGGIPAIELDQLTDLPAFASGDLLQLRAENFEPLGWGIADPETNVIWSFTSGPEEAFDPKFFHRRVQHAHRLRKRLGLTGDDAGYRLIHGEGDGLPGFQVDVYSQHVVVYSLSTALDRFAPLLAEQVGKELHAVSVISKVRPAGEVPTGKVPYRLEVGIEPPRQSLFARRT